VIILLLFAAIFFVSLQYFRRGIESSIFSLGIPGENIAVMLFSVLAIGRVVYELYRLETE
jgi:hypothetical protein